MALLEDGADVDHGVGIGTGRREAGDRRLVRGQVSRTARGRASPRRSGRCGRRRRRGARRRRRRAAWPRWTGLASASRTTGAEWKRMPTGKPSARCWNSGSAVIIDGAYRVATPAVKRPWVMKYCWNSSGSTPSPVASDSFGWGAEHLGELAVEVDELLGDLLPLVGVGVQQLRFGRARAAPRPASSRGSRCRSWTRSCPGRPWRCACGRRRRR